MAGMPSRHGSWRSQAECCFPPGRRREKRQPWARRLPINTLKTSMRVSCTRPLHLLLLLLLPLPLGVLLALLRGGQLLSCTSSLGGRHARRRT